MNRSERIRAVASRLEEMVREGRAEEVAEALLGIGDLLGSQGDVDYDSLDSRYDELRVKLGA